jgi:hypothetical protein
VIVIVTVTATATANVNDLVVLAAALRETTVTGTATGTVTEEKEEGEVGLLRGGGALPLRGGEMTGLGLLPLRTPKRMAMIGRRLHPMITKCALRFFVMFMLLSPFSLKKKCLPCYPCRTTSTFCLL